MRFPWFVSISGETTRGLRPGDGQPLQGRHRAARHRVKPGITGWAQVNGWRGETDTFDKIQKRVEHDLYYIDNWSVWLDFLFIAKTVTVLFRGEKTY